MDISEGLLISLRALPFINSRFTQGDTIVNPDADASGRRHGTYDHEYDACKLRPGCKSVFTRQHTIISGWCR
uniref:Uncharacterized protein n=1 Tax=Burkholderia cenocepacia TaxID=95486 RepID=A0A071M565_9BURK